MPSRTALALVASMLAGCTAAPHRQAAQPPAAEEVWVVARDAAAARRVTSPGAPALMARPAGTNAQPTLLALSRTEVMATLVGPIVSIERQKRYVTPEQMLDAFVVLTPPAAPARQELALRVGARRIRVLVREPDEASQAYAIAAATSPAVLLTADARGQVVGAAGTLAPGAPVELSVATVGLVPWHDGAYELTVPRVPAGDAQAIIHVHGGGPIVVVSSPSHVIDAEASGLDRLRVTLREPGRLRDADFVLRYRVDPTSAGTLIFQRDGGGTIVGLVVHPQEENHEAVALANVAIDWGATRVTDIRPAAIDTIAAGMPLVVLARTDGEVAGPAVVTGRAAGRPRRLTIPVTADAPAAGLRALSVLWARAARTELLARR